MDYRLEQLRFELREDPSSRVFFKLGEHLRREGELDEAIEILRNGLKSHERYVAAWVSLGRAQLDNGDAEGAQASLENALQLDPENTVAARTMGEAAIVNGDWIGAVKVLKRARALVPRDDDLDERIAFVEARLEELGQLEQPPVSEEAPASAIKPEVTDLAPEDGAEPFAVKAGDTGIWDRTDDVFAAGWVAEEAAAEEEPVEEEAEVEPEPFDPYSEPPPLTDDDVSPIVEPEAQVEGAQSADSVGDEEDMTAEVAKAPEDGFVAPEPELESEPEADSEPDTDIESEPEPEIQRENDLESEPEPESDLQAEDEPWPEIEPEPDTAPDTDIEPALEPEPEIEPEMEFEPETDSEPDTEIEPDSVPVSVPEPESEPDVAPEMDIEPEPEIEPDPEFGEEAQGVPLPTMTLARLAIDQGDLDLAERTLREVLEREPGHADASELLESLLAGPPEEHPDSREQKPVDPRAEALRRWLDAVRLASERLKT
jgi:Flp pilus assembly protein TadD